MSQEEASRRSPPHSAPLGASTVERRRASRDQRLPSARRWPPRPSSLSCYTSSVSLLLFSLLMLSTTLRGAWAAPAHEEGSPGPGQAVAQEPPFTPRAAATSTDLLLAVMQSLLRDAYVAGKEEGVGVAKEMRGTASDSNRSAASRSVLSTSRDEGTRGGDPPLQDSCPPSYPPATPGAERAENESVRAPLSSLSNPLQRPVYLENEHEGSSSEEQELKSTADSQATKPSKDFVSLDESASNEHIKRNSAGPGYRGRGLRASGDLEGHVSSDKLRDVLLLASRLVGTATALPRGGGGGGSTTQGNAGSVPGSRAAGLSSLRLGSDLDPESGIGANSRLPGSSLLGGGGLESFGAAAGLQLLRGGPAFTSPGSRPNGNLFRSSSPGVPSNQGPGMGSTRRGVFPSGPSALPLFSGLPTLGTALPLLNGKGFLSAGGLGEKMFFNHPWGAGQGQGIGAGLTPPPGSPFMDELDEELDSAEAAAILAVLSQVFNVVSSTIYVISGALATASSGLSLALAGPNFLVGIAQLELSAAGFLQSVRENAVDDYQARKDAVQGNIAAVKSEIEAASDSFHQNATSENSQFRAAVLDAADASRTSSTIFAKEMAAARQQMRDANSNGSGTNNRRKGAIAAANAIGNAAQSAGNTRASVTSAFVKRNAAVGTAFKDAVAGFVVAEHERRKAELLGDSDSGSSEAGGETGGDDNEGNDSDEDGSSGDGTFPVFHDKVAAEHFFSAAHPATVTEPLPAASVATTTVATTVVVTPVPFSVPFPVPLPIPLSGVPLADGQALFSAIVPQPTTNNDGLSSHLDTKSSSDVVDITTHQATPPLPNASNAGSDALHVGDISETISIQGVDFSAASSSVNSLEMHVDTGSGTIARGSGGGRVSSNSLGATVNQNLTPHSSIFYIKDDGDGFDASTANPIPVADPDEGAGMYLSVDASKIPAGGPRPERAGSGNNVTPALPVNNLPTALPEAEAENLFYVVNAGSIQVPASSSPMTVALRNVPATTSQLPSELATVSTNPQLTPNFESTASPSSSSTSSVFHAAPSFFPSVDSPTPSMETNRRGQRQGLSGSRARSPPPSEIRNRSAHNEELKQIFRIALEKSAEGRTQKLQQAAHAVIQMLMSRGLGGRQSTPLVTSSSSSPSPSSPPSSDSSTTTQQQATPDQPSTNQLPIMGLSLRASTSPAPASTSTPGVSSADSPTPFLQNSSQQQQHPENKKRSPSAEDDEQKQRNKAVPDASSVTSGYSPPPPDGDPGSISEELPFSAPVPFDPWSRTSNDNPIFAFDPMRQSSPSYLSPSPPPTPKEEMPSSPISTPPPLPTVTPSYDDSSHPASEVEESDPGPGSPSVSPSEGLSGFTSSLLLEMAKSIFDLTSPFSAETGRILLNSATTTPPTTASSASSSSSSQPTSSPSPAPRSSSPFKGAVAASSSITESEETEGPPTPPKSQVFPETEGDEIESPTSTQTDGGTSDPPEVAQLLNAQALQVIVETLKEGGIREVISAQIANLQQARELYDMAASTRIGRLARKVADAA